MKNKSKIGHIYRIDGSYYVVTGHGTVNLGREVISVCYTYNLRKPEIKKTFSETYFALTVLIS